jgi:acetyl-CoA carboxylase alpha subunit
MRIVKDINGQLAEMTTIKQRIKEVKADVLDSDQEYNTVVARYQKLSARHAELSVMDPSRMEVVNTARRPDRATEHQENWRQLNEVQARLDKHRTATVEARRLEDVLRRAREDLWATVEQITEPDHE